MNFKPSLWKSTISFLSGILINYILAGTVRVTCTSLDSADLFFCPQPHWIDFAFDKVPFIASLIAIILVYSIWSLFQKKN